MGSTSISYSNKDAYLASILNHNLKQYYMKAWRDRDNLKGSDSFENEIVKAIENTEKLLAILTTNSLNSNQDSGEMKYFQNIKSRAGLAPHVTPEDVSPLLQHILWNKYSERTGLNPDSYIYISRNTIKELRTALCPIAKNFMCNDRMGNDYNLAYLIKVYTFQYVIFAENLIGIRKHKINACRLIKELVDRLCKEYDIKFTETIIQDDQRKVEE